MLTKSPAKREYGASLDQITDVIARGEWPTEEAKPKNRGYRGKHRLDEKDPQFVTRVAIPVRTIR